MGDARLVALQAGTPGLPGRLHLAAHRRSTLIDAAMRGLSYRALQGDAMRPGCLGTAHDKAMRIECLGKLRGYHSTQGRVRLGPVEGHTEIGAAGAATQAGMEHGRRREAHPKARGDRILERAESSVQLAAPLSCTHRTDMPDEAGMSVKHGGLRLPGKRIAAGDIAAVETGAEPFDALR